MDNTQYNITSTVPILPCYNLDKTDDIDEDISFSYDGYQVVRSEFFAHISEPSISFNNCKVLVAI